jgi:hypothetical protein
MTDDAAKPEDGTLPEPPAPSPPDPPRAEARRVYEPPTPVPPVQMIQQSAGRGFPLLLALICVILLLGAGYLYWQSQGAAADIASRLDTLDQSITALNQRLSAVERRPLAPPPPPPVDLSPLEQRMTALEQKPPVPAQLDAAGHTELAGLAERIDQLTARQDQLGTREQADIAKLNDQIAALDAKITAASRSDDQVEALTTRQARLAALQRAAAALADGRPLGALPDAPPALAQFADKPPPTEASLRLSYDAAAEAAHIAGQPAPADLPFLQRVWARMQSSVTVRQGDKVLVGDPISGVLAHAREQLDAGDVAGTVATLGQLTGPAATAMAPWRQQAQSLLDARAALLTLAHG